MIRWQFHLIRQAAQVHVPERRPEALCNSVLTPALSQPRSGEAPQAASGAVAPLVPRNSCSQCGLSVCLLFSECGSSRFLKCCQPITLPPPPTRKLQMQTKNNDTATVSTWTPSPGKLFFLFSLMAAGKGLMQTHVLSDSNPPNHHKHSQ